MGLKGYRLWVMGQLDSTCRAPPRGAAHPHSVLGAQSNPRPGPRAVAAQVVYLKGKL
jgi:hypothetical protein